MSLRLLLSLIFSTLLCFSLANEIETLRNQLAAKESEVSQLREQLEKQKTASAEELNKYKQEKILELHKIKLQLQECDLGSLLKSKGKELTEWGLVLANVAWENLKVGFAWLKQNSETYSAVACVQYEKISALARTEFDKIAKQYQLEGEVAEAEKTWRNLVNTSVKQITQSVPQTEPYLAPVQENPLVVAQVLAGIVALWTLSCFCRCCCRSKKQKSTPPSKPKDDKQ
eukprot:TRINITY_DN310_c0_g1_i1.p1 TRINITY_DN310_c0_g1~~TRINITY_DN310_c0_g1_i1.p1  ORF type:complete len:252 (-),score=64.22 TRINITY_DN310_c0_g1_i1:10-696(-)